MESKKPKKQTEIIEILDESTGQMIIKDQSCDFDLEVKTTDEDYERKLNTEYDLITSNLPHNPINKKDIIHIDYNVLLEDNSPEISNNPFHILNNNSNNSNNSNNNDENLALDRHLAIKHHNLLNSGLSAHIVQNYSILAQEITAPLEPKSVSSLNRLPTLDGSSSSSNDFIAKQWISNNNHTNNTNKGQNSKGYKSNSTAQQSQQRSSSKDSATCQFCGLAMLKKNIPTHIRRAHTPKEELVCLNEEQNIFTFNYLKPGQRRKRSARAYDYSLMTATVSIDDDPCDGIENKFITEGEEILSTDLNQLADRIKYGITQIPVSTLNKLIDILSKIEYSTQDEVCANAKSIKNTICYYLAASEEFKYKIRQVSEDMIEKKKQVGNMRADLKEVMTRKAQLERRIQPLVCDLQKLEDAHGNLIESVVQMNNLIQCDILHDQDDPISIN